MNGLRSIFVRLWMLCLTSAAVATLGILAGCDSTEIDPFIDSEQYFSMYGALEMEFTKQYLRVVPIDTIIGSQDDVIDATVLATDLGTGEVWVWRDSVFTFDDGKVGHVFIGSFRIKAGHTYRVEIIRSDGATTWAETTVPTEPVAEMGEADVIGGLNFPRGTQKIFWRGQRAEPQRVEVVYRFWGLIDEPFVDLLIPYETASSNPDTSEGWEITVNYGQDAQTLGEQILGRPLRLAGTAMRIIVMADGWEPPGGVWDPEVLSQPGIFSNVNNGFGFLGSSGRFSIEWIPAATIADN
jgi:hypothetical protein